MLPWLLWLAAVATEAAHPLPCQLWTPPPKLWLTLRMPLPSPLRPRSSWLWRWRLGRVRPACVCWWVVQCCACGTQPGTA